MTTVSQIQLKRSQTTAVPPSLLEGEPAWSGNGGILFIGSNGSVVAIGGVRTPGILTANQALVANASGYLDVIKTANLYIGSVSINAINAVANSSVLGSGSNNELTTTWAIKTYVQAQVLAGSNVSAGGSNTQIQFNDSGNFGADAGFTFDKVSGKVSVGNNTVNTTVNSSAIAFGIDTVSQASPGTLQVSGSLLVPAHLQFLDDNWEIHADNANGMIFNLYSGNDRGFRFRNSALGYDLLSIDTNSNTVFINSTSGSLFVGNASSNASLTQNGLSLDGGKVVVNNSLIAVGANVKIDTVQSSWGNNTVNSSANSTVHRIENATSLTRLAADAWSVGNATVNTQINSTSVATGQAVVNTSGFFFGSFNATSTSANVETLNVGVLAPQADGWINSTANMSFTGTDIHMPNANLSVKDLNVSGNLFVSGTLTAVDATNLQVKDSMIKLADNNAADVLDLGFYALYNDGVNSRYTGLFRDATNGNYVLFANNLAEPTTTVDTANTSFAIATLETYLMSGSLVSNSSGVNITANATSSVSIAANTLTLSTALAASSGGTGLNTISDKDILVGNSTSGFDRLSFVAGSILQSNATAVFWSNVIDCGTF